MRNHGQLRIIGGEDHGRRLLSPTDLRIRPTSGMAREAIFNILQNEITGSRFLDLYAGSGCVGLEALSRGAESVTLVEHDRQGVDILRHNVSVMSRPRQCHIRVGNVYNQVEKMFRLGLRFDFIFVDPPYDEPGIAIRLVEDLLTKTGTLMYQRPYKRPVGDPFRNTRLKCYDIRRYGKSEISFWTSPDNLLEER